MTAIHIVVAMKPIEGNYAENAISSKVAGLNIDRSRVGLGKGEDVEKLNSRSGGVRGFSEKEGTLYGKSEGLPSGCNLEKGRFPANIILDGSEEVTEQFPETSGESKPRTLRRLERTTGWSGGSQKTDNVGIVHCDSGRASRFFKECKI
jgi:site-specific DNA-methyltransferase (adenine-specific)